MKKITLTLSFILLVVCISFAQQPVIIVENSTGSAAYGNLVSAITNAQAGDTIYIPAGAFGCGGNCIIDKELHFRGFGHHPFNAQATGHTVVTTDIRFATGSSNSTISGVHLNQYLRFGDVFLSSQVVNNIIVRRCNIGAVDLAANTTTNPNSQNHIFNECIIRGAFNAADVTNLKINNSILVETPYHLKNAVVEHSIILDDNFFMANNIGTTFKNNVIIANTISANNNSSNCISLNNLYVSTVSNLPAAIIDNGSFFNQSISNIFVNQSTNDFSYLHDYHLPSGSLGINAATDNTNIGIYGGSAPFKESMMPLQPYIKNKVINGTTDPAGNVQITFEVEGQDN
ncbi:MAG: hypothetical protein ACPG19_00210 [Saprospiraceae bacterium]